MRVEPQYPAWGRWEVLNSELEVPASSATSVDFAVLASVSSVAPVVLVAGGAVFASPHTFVLVESSHSVLLVSLVPAPSVSLDLEAETQPLAALLSSARVPSVGHWQLHCLGPLLELAVSSLQLLRVQETSFTIRKTHPLWSLLAQRNQLLAIAWQYHPT